MKQMNIFISWSGDRSKAIALAFYEWLPMVVQSAKPWLSALSIDKGSRGLVEITKALEGVCVGVTFLTPENLTEPWILYEAGCLTKTVDDKTRLCTYLLGGLQPKDIEPPLSQFQHTRPEKDDTLHLIRTINKAVNEEPIAEKTLDGIFERLWPDLESRLKSLPPAPKPVTKRPLEDMVAELLDLARAQTNVNAVTAAYIGVTGLTPLGGPPAPPPELFGAVTTEPRQDHKISFYGRNRANVKENDPRKK